MRIAPSVMQYLIYILLPFGGYGIYTTTRSAQKTNLMIWFDDLPNLTVTRDIKRVIWHIFTSYGTIPSASSLCTILKKIYAFIQDIRIIHYPEGKTRIYIRSQQPCALINSKYILSQTGSLFDSSYYAVAAYNNLPVIQTATYQDQCQLLIFAQKLPFDISQEYTFTWFDKTNIYAQDKRSPWLNLRLTVNTFTERNVKKFLILLKDIIRQQKQVTCFPKNRSWFIDMRCGDRFIVAQQGDKKS